MAITLNGTTGITTPKLDALDLELGSKNVVESGSNANGEYVRFADGTQICWLQQAAAAPYNINQLSGGFYYRDVTLTFPASFAISNVVATVGTRSAGIVLTIASAGEPNSTTITTRLITATSSENVNVRHAYIAVGRWY